MRKLDYLQPRKLNRNDELRDLLKQLEDSQPLLQKMNPTQALITLRNLDQVYGLLAELEVSGAELPGEQARFEGIQAELKKQAVPFLKGLGGPATVGDYRPKPAPSREQWWWYIDEWVAAQRRRLLKRIIGIGAVLIIVLAGLVVAFNTVLAPSPEAIARLEGETQSLAAFNNADYDAALAAVDRSLEIVPEDARLLTLRGIYLELLGREQEAGDVFQQARRSSSDPVNFYIDRGQYYLRTNQIAKSEADARSALNGDEDSPAAWLLLGQVLELQNERSEAIAAYQYAAELAAERDDNEVVILARLALGRISAGP